MATEKLQEALYYIEATVLHATTTAASRGVSNLGIFSGPHLIRGPRWRPQLRTLSQKIKYSYRTVTLMQQFETIIIQG